MPEKPPYRVPSMAEIKALPWNGYNVVSTFSGCGGSSLGYRLAGFRVLWASEFVEAARDCYRANASPGTLVDGRDIRQVQPADILAAVGLRPGELDLFDGSPPCSSFSTAGRREQGWGKVKKYSDTAQRTDDLFFEYVRLLTGLRPKVFVAENVAGLVKGTAKGYFKIILEALKGCGYRVQARVLDAQWLGVPQSRTRLIFVGVRADLGLNPVHPEPLPYRYALREALPHVAAVQCGDPRHRQAPGNSFPRGKLYPGDQPCPCVQATASSIGGAIACAIVEPDADISRFAIGAEWDKLKPGQRSGRYFSLHRADLDRPSPIITASGGHPSTAGVTHPTEKRKFTIAELKRLCSFPDDFVLSGSYAQQWERCGRAVPPVMMSHIAATVRDRVLAKQKG